MTATVTPPCARIVHHVPGRMRIRFARATISREHLDQLRQAVLALDGVQHCETNATTGGMLVHYDEATFDFSALDGVVGGIAQDGFARTDRRRNDAAEEADSGPSHLARHIDVRARLLDRRLRRATGGRVDLRTIVPIGFAGLALREIVAHPASLPAIPWYVLLWYAFDSYFKLQGTPTGQVTHSLMEAVAEAGPGEG